MADGLTVELGTLLEAAQVVRGLPEQINTSAVTGALQRVADAVPTGRLAAAAAAEADAWTRDVGSLVDLLSGHASVLELAAETYREADSALGVSAQPPR